MRRPSLTAASTMSASISTSSGSTAAGSMRTALTSRSPLTFTVTMPPPAEASTISFLSCSWAASMSRCIFCTCGSICCMFGLRGCLGILRHPSLALAGALAPALGPLAGQLLGVELLHEACSPSPPRLPAARRSRPRRVELLAQLVGQPPAPARELAQRLGHDVRLAGSSAFFFRNGAVAANATMSSSPSTATGWASSISAPSSAFSARTRSTTAGHSARSDSRSALGAPARRGAARPARASALGGRGRRRGSRRRPLPRSFVATLAPGLAAPGARGGAGAARLAASALEALDAREQRPGGASSAGLAALTSASSRRVRASAPARTPSIASPSSSSRRTTTAARRARPAPRARRRPRA